MRPRELVEEGVGISLVERMALWRQESGKTARPSGVKRKRAPGAGEQRTAHPHNRISGGEGATPFKARMLEKQTPAGVCVFALCGTVCLRVPCLMTDNRSTRQRSPSPRNSSINLGRRCCRLHHPDCLRCNSHNRTRQPP